MPHFQFLLEILGSEDWRELWEGMDIEVESFERLGIAPDTPDSALWRTCQERQTILITANRNVENQDSLETTIRRLATPSSLPVFTLADPERVLRDRHYAERVASRLMEYLIDVDAIRGAGRLYLP